LQHGIQGNQRKNLSAISYSVKVVCLPMVG
jgi:hypothetical protein